MVSSARSATQFIYTIYIPSSAFLQNGIQYLKWQTYQLIHQVQTSKYLCLFCPIRCCGQSPQFWSISVTPLGLNLVSYTEAHNKKRKKDEEQLAASLSKLPANFSCHPCPGLLIRQGSVSACHYFNKVIYLKVCNNICLPAKVKHEIRRNCNRVANLP